MIASKDDYRFAMESDRIALGIKRLRPRLVGDEIWRYQRLLRKTEYILNCRKSLVWAPYRYFLLLRLHRAGIRLGFSIHPNVFGPGLSIAHRGTIVVHPNVRVGENCRLHVCVNIGTKAGDTAAVPVIGDNVYIGPGAKIFGQITLADDIAVGANAVVNKTFDERGIGIAGAPARKINQKGSEGLVIKATGILRASEGSADGAVRPG